MNRQVDPQLHILQKTSEKVKNYSYIDQHANKTK